GIFNGTYCYRVICHDNCSVTIDHWYCGPSTTPTPTKPSTTVSTTPVKSTPTKTPSTTALPGCPFDPWREHNETWYLCNCTIARCLENNTIEIVEVKCEPPPKIECANGHPPIAVPDDDLCCWHWECDCVCTGWGDPHYVTFDGTYYSYQGNCTYVLFEEIRQTVDNFGVYIDNYDCGAQDLVSCPRNIIVRHETQTIQIVVLVNGQIVGIPYSKFGVKIYRSGINYVVEIPELQANVTYNGLAFSVKLPFRLFGHNTQGQCGTCTNNKTEDCRLPSGEIISNCEIMADAWAVEDPRKPYCGTSIKPTKPPAPTCEPSLLNNKYIQTFGFSRKYHTTVLPPTHFYQACVFDSCHVPDGNMECISLQQYALMCAGLGVCIDWRSHAPECQDNDENNNRIIEGCYCPYGTMPFSSAVDVCVETCGKRKEFQIDCQDCVCREGGSGIICTKRECGDKEVIQCELDGFYPVTVPSPTDPCCTVMECKCDTNRCYKPPPNCGLGHEVVSEIPDGQCCPVYSCVRKNVCVHGNAEYLPGSPVYSDKCQTCVCPKDASVTTGLEIECTHVACNVTCPEGFELQSDNGDCCGVCVQTHCVLNENGKYTLLSPGEHIQAEDDNCTIYSCTVIRRQFITSVSTISCPYFDEKTCEPVSILVGFVMPRVFVKNNLTTDIKPKPMKHVSNMPASYSSARSIAHSCTCCHEVRTIKKFAKLQCDDGSVVTHKFIDTLIYNNIYSKFTRPNRQLYSALKQKRKAGLYCSMTL
uniref:Mucin-2 n=1 Tax=Leptobrachium leishanense TaxID=445787 RepID=A0A8C5MIP5_9ANUR